jgi:hypothetical protein
MLENFLHAARQTPPHWGQRRQRVGDCDGLDQRGHEVPPMRSEGRTDGLADIETGCARFRLQPGMEVFIGYADEQVQAVGLPGRDDYRNAAECPARSRQLVDPRHEVRTVAIDR